MTALDPIALADYPQIAYHLYTKLLPAFLVCSNLSQVYVALSLERSKLHS